MGWCAGTLAVFAVGVACLGIPRAGLGAEIGPSGEWCSAIRALPPAEEAILEPGEYRGPCTIDRGGNPGAPLVIRAQNPADPPRIAYPGRDSNMLNVRASHVTIRGLHFVGPTLPSVDGIRIYQGDGVTIEDCRFSDIGGIAIVANHSSLRDLVIRRNEIVRSKATAMYFGCHDGAWCKVTGLVVEQNYIHGVRAPNGQVGYGIQVKWNSTAAIRDNLVLDTKGPGIMVYGASDLSALSVIERNFLEGSRTSSGIVVGGGPAIVRNNVTAGSSEAGISLENYGRRNLLRGIIVAHNTVYGNDQGGIVVPTEGPVEARIVNNAVHAPPGKPTFPAEGGQVLSQGNADCARDRCFADPRGRDYSPVGLKSGIVLLEHWMPRDDYFGRGREASPTVGALQGPAAPISLGVKLRPQAQ